MIGVYDSGVGGLAVLREIRRLLPDADIVYLADQANVPYGERPLPEIRSLALAAGRRLVDLGADTVVVACNTASAAALTELRQAFPTVEIVGMEPAVKPAAATTRNGRIAVLATEATFAAARFEDLVGRYASDAEVIAHPCPGWAAAVEEDWPEAAGDRVAEHLAPLVAAGVDTVVLACTHYSFLARPIADAMGPNVVVVDPVDAVARHAASVAPAQGSGATTYLTTGEPECFAAQVLRLLGLEVTAGRA